MSESDFIPVGYMYKRVAAAPADLPSHVKAIYSAGTCGAPRNSDNFVEYPEYIHYSLHNRFCLFDSPAKMEKIAVVEGIDLSEMTLFYYECSALEFDFVLVEPDDEDEVGEWMELRCWWEECETDIVIPSKANFVGFDVVEFVGASGPECSLLSCSNIATESPIPVNSYCLYDSFEDAKTVLESGIFHKCEPGPYRIFKTYLIEEFGKTT